MGSPEAECFDARDASAQLWALASRYWSGEAEIVRLYLRHHRSTTRDIAWLRLQAYKEARLYRELPPAARRHFDRTGQIIGQPPSLGQRLEEELRHFELICGLIEMLGGVPPGALEVLEFPADRELQNARYELRTSGDPLARSVSELVEGGGGAMYQVLSELDADEFSRRLARVFAAIHGDELRHGPAELGSLAGLLRDVAEGARATRMLRRLCRLRIAMRAEMFGGIGGAGFIDALES